MRSTDQTLLKKSWYDFTEEYLVDFLGKFLEESLVQSLMKISGEIFAGFFGGIPGNISGEILEKKIPEQQLEDLKWCSGLISEEFSKEIIAKISEGLSE